MVTTRAPSEEARERETAKPASPWERWLIRRALAAMGGPPLTVVLWTGEEIGPASVDERRGTRDERPGSSTLNPQSSTLTPHSSFLSPQPSPHRIVIEDRRTLWKLLLDPVFQFGECYANGSLEIEDPLPDVLTDIERALHRPNAGGVLSEGLSNWLHRPRRTTLSGSKQNIHHHYDIGNEFYQLWLDEQLVYTCAYFAEPTFSLEQAQVAKMDHVCRKLQLQPGEAVIEAGCGWGALALHMAKHYGVAVTAYNISHEQVEYATERARAEGLDDRVTFVEDDWRNIHGECDAFVSVGMLEHVGLANYRLLGDVIHRTLKPDGRGLIHTIGMNNPRRLNTWIERRIFPGAQPPALRQMMDIFEPHGFSILDVENLRLHYAETLRHWLDRYEECVDEVREMFDEPFVRTWRFYLACSIAAFEAGWLQLFQVVFAPGTKNTIPWTRDHLYQG